jgi:peptidoglycan/LPS O-acetylase OafA/YrhL
MKLQLPNLNTIRLIAATMVLVNHAEHFKEHTVFTSLWRVAAIQQMGRLGVVMFFVLSGFLITYLLIAEEKITNKIAVKEFYIRRVLRIWPLYFLILLLGFFLFPNLTFFTSPEVRDAFYNDAPTKLALFVFIMPNVVAALFGFDNWSLFNPIWSIGVEEQFYLFWPLIFKNKKLNKKLVVLSIIIGYFLIKTALTFLPQTNLIVHLRDFIYLFTVDCMAIGSLMALLFVEKHKIVEGLLFKKWFQWLIFPLTIFMIVKGVYIPSIQSQIYAILFGIIILNLALNDNRIFNIDTRLTKYLGKVSYGIYMYHSIVVFLCIKAFQNLQWKSTILLEITFLLFTFLVAALSYELLEKHFIKLKIKFSKIISGDNVVEMAKTENK